MKQITATRRHEKGQILIEVLIALALLGMIATTFLGAMYTALQAARISEEKSATLTLVKSEIEYIKDQPYSENDWAYSVSTTERSTSQAPSWWATSPPPLLPAEYEGYSVDIAGVSDIDLDGTGGPDEGIRTITAVARRDGQVIFTMEDYEVDR
ncbi:MAG: prepilin-type N-terminal cleavage/methylation domain-containing protein [Dehalococcoidia bacterium]|nr:prepilin-type N-terminal cleavage/methylation domain-containing protein [Dehalococcoidia bacterium]